MQLIHEKAQSLPGPLKGAGRVLAGCCLALFGAAGGAPDAQAGPLDARAIRCYVNQGGMGPSRTMYSAYAGNQYSIYAGRTSVAVPANPTRGQPLFAVELALPRLEGGERGKAAPLYACPPGASETFASARPLIGGTDIYKTSRQGIGFRIFYYVTDGSSQTAPITYINNFSSGALVFPFNSSEYLPNARTRIEVVATGDPIVPGLLNTTEISAVTTLANLGMASPPVNLYAVSMYGNVSFSVPTCSVSNPSALSITLPDANVTALKAGTAGSVSSTTLQVMCTSSSAQAPTLSIAGSTVQGYDTTLKNQEAAATAAKGVGVTLWVYDTQTGTFRPPKMGVADKNLGSPVGAVPTASWSYQIGASYQQVEPTPTAGAVSAKATLTFSYS